MVAENRRPPPPPLSLLTTDYSPAVAAVDAESGRLLRLVRYQGGKPVLCKELRDLAPDESDDFGFEPPPGLRVEEHPPDAGDFGPAGIAGKGAADAARVFFGSLRDRWH